MILLIALQSTLSFSDQVPSAHPGTVRARKSVEVDLSAIPAGAEIFRAVLRPGRDEPAAAADRRAPVRVSAGAPLPLAAPTFAAFDATEAVRAALRAEPRRAAFEIEALPGYLPALTRLDVTSSAPAKTPPPAVKDLRVRHRGGQTLLTWTEIDPPPAAGDVVTREWREKLAALGHRRREVRYRVWRADAPLTPATIGRAALLAEVEPLSGWNPDVHGVSPKDEDPVPRYVVDEGEGPVAAGTGIYAHNPAAPGRAFYAVTAMVDGQEDLSAFSTSDAVVEVVGPGEPVLQRVERPKSFSFVDAPTLHYYVRWEAPPRANRASRPYDYLVALPPKRLDPAPVGLHLHCWGGNLEGGYGWWYNAARGAVLVSTNQIPYDWWTGYHEFTGTWRPWGEGAVRDYTQTRVMAFLDWAAKRWPLDLSRVFTAGSSMGGSGSPNLGLRRADRVAWVVSWVGVHTPARSPQFRGSYERVFGGVDWKIPFQGSATPAFDHFDDERFARLDPAADTPLICFSNGKNDAAIGWPQARDFWKALQDTRRPHVFVWGQDGHGQRALLPGPDPNERELGVDVRVDRTLPAFTRCSLDGRPDADDAGQSNLWLYWDAEAVDEKDRWSMTLRLARKAPEGECRVDVTPRRCRAFRVPAGTRVAWTAGTTSGDVAADAHGLVTVPQVTVTTSGTTLTLEVKK
ncbi:MAG TPA: hypothetical protein VF950_10345 [Planctomycetota bacterium]